MFLMPNLNLLTFLMLSAFKFTPTASRTHLQVGSGHHDSDDCKATRIRYDTPIELISEILRHLHYHDVTLRSCSLVCKAWVPLSR